MLVFSYGAGLSQIESDRLRLALQGSARGLTLFFVLSGYLLYLPFARRDFGGGGPVDLPRYARNRILRIVPLYLTAVWLLLIPRSTGARSSSGCCSAPSTAGSTTRTQRRSCRSAGPSWPSCTSTSCCPPLAWAIGRVGRGSMRRAVLVLGLLAAGSLVVRYETLYAGEGSRFLILSLPGIFFFFATGMGLALLRVRWDRHPPALPAPADRAWAWVALAAVFLVASAWWFARWPELFTAPFAFLLIGACVLPVREGLITRALEWRPLVAVGVASYSLYIWHYALLRWLSGAYGDAGDSRALLRWRCRWSCRWPPSATCWSSARSCVCAAAGAPSGRPSPLCASRRPRRGGS